MRIPLWLSNALLSEWYQESLVEFFLTEKWITSKEELFSDRFLSRSVQPHLERLSAHFNRLEGDPDESGLAPYWKSSSHSDHVRMAYFLAYFPSNFIRTASVMYEVAHRCNLSGLSQKPLRVLELGSGPAASTNALAFLATRPEFAIFQNARFAWIESDRKMLDAAQRYFSIFQGKINAPPAKVDLFHRKILQKPGDTVLPPRAPQFDIILSSFFWNELNLTPEGTVEAIEQMLHKHLSRDGFFIWIDPALKAQSRKVLTVRKLLLERRTFTKQFSVRLPCMGHQECGALRQAEDWCHEEVVWWRPEILRKLDNLVELDHRRLPFSYLVIQKQKSNENTNPFYRLVSPSHEEGKAQEFFLCGTSGKSRARIHPSQLKILNENREPVLVQDRRLMRGDLLETVSWESQNETQRLKKLNSAEVSLQWNPGFCEPDQD